MNRKEKVAKTIAATDIMSDEEIRWRDSIEEEITEFYNLLVKRGGSSDSYKFRLMGLEDALAIVRKKK